MTTVRRGREKLHFLNTAPINDIAERWISSYDRARAAACPISRRHWRPRTNGNATDRRPSSTAPTSRPRPSCWQGLAEPKFTRRYWRRPTAGGVSMATDWQKGSTYDLTYDEGSLVVEDAQVVLESDPYRRLAYTWHTFLSGVGHAARLRRGDRRRPGAPSRAPRSPSTSRRPARASSSSPSCTTASGRGARSSRVSRRDGRRCWPASRPCSRPAHRCRDPHPVSNQGQIPGEVIPHWTPTPRSSTAPASWPPRGGVAGVRRPALTMRYWRHAVAGGKSFPSTGERGRPGTW